MVEIHVNLGEAMMSRNKAQRVADNLDSVMYLRKFLTSPVFDGPAAKNLKPGRHRRPRKRWFGGRRGTRR